MKSIKLQPEPQPTRDITSTTVSLRCHSYALVNCKTEFVTPWEWCVMVGSWREKCWPRGVPKSNFCQSKQVRYVRHGPSMSLDRFMASRTTGHFALRVWTVKKCLTSPRSRHAQPACTQPLWPSHHTTKFTSQTKATYTTLEYMYIYMYMYMVHVFWCTRTQSTESPSVSLVLQNFSCLGMTPLK